MTLSTIISMLIGVGIPGLIALVSKEALPAHITVLLTLLLTSTSGVLSSVLGSLPRSLNGWEHVLLNILMTFLAAAATDVAAWKPSGATVAITRATSRFGLGRASR